MSIMCLLCVPFCESRVARPRTEGLRLSACMHVHMYMYHDGTYIHMNRYVCTYLCICINIRIYLLRVHVLWYLGR